MQGRRQRQEEHCLKILFPIIVIIFAITPSRWEWKMFVNISGIKLAWMVWLFGKKIMNISSRSQVIYTTLKISQFTLLSGRGRRRKRNVSKCKSHVQVVQSLCFCSFQVIRWRNSEDWGVDAKEMYQNAKAMCRSYRAFVFVHSRWFDDVIRRTGEKSFNAVSHHRARLYFRIQHGRGEVRSRRVYLNVHSVTGNVVDTEWFVEFWRWKYCRGFGNNT